MPNTQGGLQGALAGAQLGSAAGPWGAVGGGVLGGLLGLGTESREDRLNRMTGAQDENIARLLAQLQARAGGQHSTADMQLRQGLDRAMAQQSSMAASARPGQGALAQRIAAQNQAKIASGAAGQSALLRLQEERQAQGQLGTLLAQLRGQDINMAQGLQKEPTGAEQMLGFAEGIGQFRGLVG